jgi:hypothetical protein
MKPQQSLNTWTTVVGFFIAALFTSQGVEVKLTAEQISEALMTKEGIGLAVFFFMNLYTPIIKTWGRVKGKQWNWSALYSRNLAAHLTSLIAVVAGIWFDHEEVGFLVVMLTQGLNFIFHRIKPTSATV